MSNQSVYYNWSTTGTTTSNNNIYINPTVCGSTIYDSIDSDGPGTLILLNKKDIPKVYASGRLLTIGVIGTECECAFLNTHLYIKNKTLNCVQFGKYLYVTLEYKNEFENYKLNFCHNSNKYLPVLISRIGK